MAKLKGPLMSLGATQKLGDTLVFFPWKGLNVVRTWVKPSNPQTTAQNTQRGYMADAVAAIHAQMADGTNPLVEADKNAYQLAANQEAQPRTWFNQAAKIYVDLKVAGIGAGVWGGGSTTPGSDQLAVIVYSPICDGVKITAGSFKYGTSPSALINTQAATITGGSLSASATITGLTTGVKYYWQFVATAAPGYLGNKTGIYYGTPT